MNKVPFIKLVILLATGIVLSTWINLSMYYSLLLLVIIFVILILAIIIQNKNLRTIITAIAVIFLGIVNAKLLDDRNHPRFFANYAPQYLLLEVYDNIKVNKKSTSYYAKVRQVNLVGSSKFISSIGNIYITSNDDYIPKIGDLIIVKSNFKLIPKIKVLSGFDKHKFFANNNIYYEQHIQSGRCYRYGNSTSFNSRIHSLNGWIQSIFTKNLSHKSASFANAYILGSKNILDSSDKENFSVSGVMHILAVSGLHVGMLYVLLSFCTSFLYKYRYGQAARFTIIILLLVLYAFITKLSPGVFRATLMLIIGMIATTSFRKINIYNIIFASMFIILCARPNDIYSIGFQLSYSAVLGIVSFQHFFSYYLKAKNIILKYILGIINISLSAQLATGLLSLYYFHKLPVYFLLANLLIIPVAWITMISLIALLLFFYIPIVSSILIWINEHLINIIYTIINYIAKLPYSSLSIWIDHINMILVYALLITLTLYLLLKNYRYIICSLIILLILLNYLTLKNFKNLYRNKLIVHNNYKTPIVGVVSNGSYKLIYESPNTDTNSIKAYYKKSGFSEKNIKNLYLSKNILVLNDKTILLINKDNEEPIKATTVDFKVNYIVISRDAKIDVGLLRKRLHPDIIIIDSTNNYETQTFFRNQCSLNGQSPCYFTKYKGDFAINI
ncbi:MAG: ComEC/Rec2 family competence protein [Solitalea-like symbiont of Tyrophagus putrescentiae]